MYTQNIFLREAKRWSASLGLLPSYATACNSLQKEPVDVTGYFLPSNKKILLSFLPVVSFRRRTPCMESHSGSLLGLLASLNSGRRDRSWQTLWSTSVSIRSRQHKKNVCWMSHVRFRAVKKMWGLHLETCLWRLFIAWHLPAIGHRWQRPRTLQINSDIAYSFGKSLQFRSYLHINLLLVIWSKLNIRLKIQIWIKRINLVTIWFD